MSSVEADVLAELPDGASQGLPTPPRSGLQRCEPFPEPASTLPQRGSPTVPFTYQQTTGRFTQNGNLIGIGYSGNGAGLNNPAEEQTHGVGPIPAGPWTIGVAHTDGHLGPIVMNLDPVPPFDAFGRTLFRIHGDNDLMNHSASDGCIVLGPAYRTQIAAAVASGDTALTVIP
ncbi:MAG: tlde1 domain-containing protein [Caulobacterales bacterium]